MEEKSQVDNVKEEKKTLGQKITSIFGKDKAEEPAVEEPTAEVKVEDPTEESYSKAQFDEAIEKAKADAIAEYQKQQEEQARKEQMTPEEIKAEEDAKKDKELEKLKHDILVRDCKDNAIKNLSTAGLPVELADVLDYTSEETVEKSLGVVKDVFVACLEKGIKERLKGKTPVGLNANKDITEISDRKARMQKIMGINKK